MCPPGAQCGCGGGSAAPVGLAVVVVALAAAVSAAWVLVGQVLLVVLVAVYAVLAVAVGGLWWLLRREGVLRRRVPTSAGAPLAGSRRTALPVGSPRALEPPRARVVAGSVEREREVRP